MAEFYLRSSSATERLNSTVYAVGVRVVIARADAQANFAVMRRYVYECTVGGTTAAAPPVYPVAPDTSVVDGTVTWVCRECTSWINANRYMDYLAPRLAAGDDMLVSHAHAESSQAGVTSNFNGTPTQPVRILCVSDVDGSLATTATVSTTGANGMVLNGSIRSRGVEYVAGTGSSGGGFNLTSSGSTDTVQVHENSVFKLNTSSGSVNINIGTSATSNGRHRIVWKSCDARLFNATQALRVYQEFNWRGGSWLGGTISSYLFSFGAQGRSSPVLIEGVDFTGMAAASDLVIGTSAGRIVFRNCKLPSSWTGALVQGACSTGLRVEMHNCDSSGNTPRLWIEEFSGTVITDTGFKRNGGANNGVADYSFLMKSNPNANDTIPLGYYTDLPKWNTVVGTEVTATIEILSDSLVPLTNADIWIEMQYLGTDGVPTTSFVSGERSNVRVAGVDHAASSEAWATGSMVNPNRQKLSVKFTPRAVGFLMPRVVLAKPSTTVAVCPKMQVS